MPGVLQGSRKLVKAKPGNGREVEGGRFEGSVLSLARNLADLQGKGKRAVRIAPNANFAPLDQLIHQVGGRGASNHVCFDAG